MGSEITPGVLLARAWTLLTRRLDGPLLAAALALAALGLIVLYSAADQSLARVGAQAGNLAVALACMWLVANVSPQHLARAAVPLYVAGVLLLVGVATFGVVVNGARRWLPLGFTRIQPSELMKIALPLMLAWYFNRHEARLRLREFAVAAGLMVVPIALIVRQPDLGTALLLAGVGFYVLFLAGLDWRLMLALGAIGGAAIPLAWPLLHDYQRERVLTMLDPSRDPLGSGYHIIQSTIAVGSGGLFGKGWLNGTQTHLDFLPERHTDFIFAVFSEEFGLVGNVVLLLLYLALIARGMTIAANASTLFARLLAGAVTLMFVTYAFVNMGMVTGILPVVGVPLPFVSYGGTAMVTLFIGVGLLMNAQANRKLVTS